MRYARGLVLLVLVMCPSVVEAQPIFGYPIGGFGFGYQRRHLVVSGFWGGPVYGYPFAPYPVYGFPRTSISFFYQPPPVVVSSPVVINQPIVVLPERAAAVTEDDRFIRFMPRKLDPGAAKPRPEMARRPEIVPAPPPAPTPAKPPEKAPPKPPAPKAQPLPRGRSDRLLVLGMTAFAEGLHGRAERFFLQATEVPPVDPLAYFYLGQAQFARAEYQEAAASIQAGLRILPEWVRGPFRSNELYGPNAGDFQDHLKRLEETLARFPNDPHLLFLYGYHLWFLGRHEEARTQFQRAAAVTPDPALIQLFLNARVPAPTSGNSSSGRAGPSRDKA